MNRCSVGSRFGVGIAAPAMLRSCWEGFATDAPVVTRSMRTTLHDLKLDRLYVAYPGADRFALDDRIEAVPLRALLPARGVDVGAA